MNARETVVIAVMIVAVILIGEALVYVFPQYEADSEIQYGDSGIVLQLDTNYSTDYTVLVTQTESNAEERHLYIYRDSGYPSLIDDDYLGYWIDRMYAEFEVYGYSDYTVIDAEGIRDVMAGSVYNGVADRTAIMILSGVLPDTVYGEGNTLLEDWLGLGGALYWTGGPLGYYVGHPNDTEDPLEVFDKDPGGRFLGKHDSIAVSEEQVLGTDPSDQHEIGLALGIYYDDCSYGVSSSVQDSIFIGMEVDGYNSISISRYAGGDGIICVFGGDFPPNVKETAHSNILKVFFSGLSYDSKVIMLKCSSKDPGSVEIPLGLDEGEDVVVFVFCGTMLGTFGETHRIMSEVGTESSGDEAQTSGDSIKGITRMEAGGRKP